jgi:hypothetical protein
MPCPLCCRCAPPGLQNTIACAVHLMPSLLRLLIAACCPGTLLRRPQASGPGAPDACAQPHQRDAHVCASEQLQPAAGCCRLDAMQPAFLLNIGVPAVLPYHLWSTTLHHLVSDACLPAAGVRCRPLQRRHTEPGAAGRNVAALPGKLRCCMPGPPAQHQR